MKPFIVKNWYKLLMSISFFILSCGVFIFSIKSNRAIALPNNKGIIERVCVGGAIEQDGPIYVFWSDGTVSRAERK